MNVKTMKRISTWGKVLGVVMMIFGGIYAILGLFAFVVGAIPGAVTSYMGYLIFKTGKAAQNFIESQSEESIANLLDGYAKFLLTHGILLIVSLVILVLFLIIGGIGIFATIGHLGGY